MASPTTQITLPFFYLRFGEPSDPGLNKTHASDQPIGQTCIVVHYKVHSPTTGRPTTALLPANIAKACCSPPVRE